MKSPDTKEGKTIRIRSVRACQCAICQQEGDFPEKLQHHQMNLFLSRLNEQQRRWYVALEAQQRGHGGEKLLSEITGMDGKTIRRAIAELAQELEDRPLEHVRRPGGGRPRLEKKRPFPPKSPESLG